MDYLFNRLIMGNSHNKDKKEETYYTLEDVKQHTSENDCWMIIKDCVYDVSDFKHPGGKIIKTGYGTDATDLFYNPYIKHSSHAKKLLKKYYIGKLKA